MADAAAGPEAARNHARLVDCLRQPARYPHPVGPVRVIETHLSSVLLTGAYAYKIKKPLNLGFADFSTLRRRHFCCNEELRLNRRLAASLYLDVVPIFGCPDDPRFCGPGPIIEYAVRMREFDQHDLADAMLARGALTGGDIDRLARVVATFHSHVPRASRVSIYGSPRSILGPVLQNFAQLRGLPATPSIAASLERIEAWSLAAHRRLTPQFAARLDAGYVRECHGDLHLGNIAIVSGEVQVFDCIEFNPGLRWIDVASEIAFLTMDLDQRGRPDLAWRFVDAWLQESGDVGALPLLDFYLVYRATVRGKVACLRAAQAPTGRERTAALAGAASYLACCERRMAPRRPALIVMHGLAGSGKTTVSQALLEHLPAVRLRSDVERKRLHGIDDPLARTGALIEGGIYSAAAGERTYGRLAELARACLAEGWPVIVDAAALRRAERERFRVLAREAGAPFALVACNASREMLLRRVAERAARGSDASDADAAVLQRQLERIETPGVDEAGDLVQVDTNSEAGLREGTARILARLAAAAGAT
jgi:hypothetical protein